MATIDELMSQVGSDQAAGIAQRGRGLGSALAMMGAAPSEFAAEQDRQKKEALQTQIQQQNLESAKVNTQTATLQNRGAQQSLDENDAITNAAKQSGGDVTKMIGLLSTSNPRAAMTYRDMAAKATSAELLAEKSLLEHDMAVSGTVASMLVPPGMKPEDDVTDYANGAIDLLSKSPVPAIKAAGMGLRQTIGTGRVTGDQLSRLRDDLLQSALPLKERYDAIAKQRDEMLKQITDAPKKRDDFLTSAGQAMGGEVKTLADFNTRMNALKTNAPVDGLALMPVPKTDDEVPAAVEKIRAMAVKPKDEAGDSRQIDIRLDGKDVPADYIPGKDGRPGKILYNGLDVTAKAQKIPAASITIHNEKEAKGSDNRSELAEMVRSGTMPPSMLSKRSDDYNDILAEASRKNKEENGKPLNIAKLQLDYEAAKKWVLSLNSPQMVRFKGLAASVVNTIDEVKRLADELKQGGIQKWNEVSRETIQQVYGNTPQSQAANQYVTAVNTLKEEFANLANGGFAPTEPAWALANKQINENMGFKDLTSNLVEIQRLINYRINATENVQPTTLGGPAVAPLNPTPTTAAPTAVRGTKPAPSDIVNRSGSWPVGVKKREDATGKIYMKHQDGTVTEEVGP